MAKNRTLDSTWAGYNPARVQGCRVVRVMGVSWTSHRRWSHSATVKTRPGPRIAHRCYEPKHQR
jgi:hypothetical protein